MILLTHDTPILLGVEPADFRKGVDGFQRLCRAALGQDPTSGTVFVFVNRANTMIRALAHDGTGYWLMTKRLSKGRVVGWPTSSGVVSPTSARELRALLHGGSWASGAQRPTLPGAAMLTRATSALAPAASVRRIRRPHHTCRATSSRPPCPPSPQPEPALAAPRTSPASPSCPSAELDALIRRVEEARDHGLALSAADLGLLLNALLTLASVTERLEHDDLTLARMRKLLGIVRSSERLKDLTGVRGDDSGDRRR